MKIAGVVVLYNPDFKVESNIKSYIDDIDILFVVDNSDKDKKNIKLIKKLCQMDKVSYIDNRGNKGIANALNIGAVKAIKGKYEYLLTMDQDSYASKEMINKMVEYILEHSDEKLGVVTAYQKYPYEKTCYFLKPYEHVLVAMTSGNLLNLDAYKKTGKFLEKLFIEYVDFEYCLRLNTMGYKVVSVNQAILYHNHGTCINVKGVKVVVHNHIRMYYTVRNGLFLINKYKDIFPYYVSQFKEQWNNKIRKNVLYGEKRLLKAVYIIRAVIDYYFNRFGKVK